MPVHPDYEEFVASLNANRVKYVIVGAHAVGFYGAPRWTKDMDFWVQSTALNARRFIQTLEQFFGDHFGLEPADLTEPETILQFGVAPVRIDVLTTIKGVRFETCWRKRVRARYGSQPTNYISLPHLIQAKRASDRAQDRLDVKRLMRISSRQSHAPG